MKTVFICPVCQECELDPHEAANGGELVVMEVDVQSFYDWYDDIEAFDCSNCGTTVYISDRKDIR